MWEEIQGRLTSPNPQVRLEAWQELYPACAGNALVLKRNHLLRLNELLLREQHSDVAERASRVVAALGTLLAARSGGGPVNHDRPGTLGNWLWKPFRSCSAVFMPVDPENHRRDESATIVLARHLSFHAFPNTDFHQVILDAPVLDRLLLHRPYEAFCLIGRPGLYGAETSRLWSNDRARFASPCSSGRAACPSASWMSITTASPNRSGRGSNCTTPGTRRPGGRTLVWCSVTSSTTTGCATRW
jgi:hypothetical protein